MVQDPRHIPRTLALNYPEFPDSCLGLQLACVVDVYEVLVGRLHGDLIQFRDLTLREPHGLAVEANLQAGCTVEVD